MQNYFKLICIIFSVSLLTNIAKANYPREGYLKKNNKHHTEEYKGPVRNGVTLDIYSSFGYSFSATTKHYTPDYRGPIMQPYSISLGGFFNPNLSIGVKHSLLYYGYRQDNSGKKSITITFTGPQIQYWLDNNWFLAGGPAIATYNINNNTDAAAGVVTRVGYALANIKNHSLYLNLENSYGYIFVDDFHFINSIIGIGWQWF